MYWNEKLDLVKRNFPDGFKDPFRAGPEVVKKIVTILFKSTLLNFIESDNRAGLLKHGSLTRRCSLKQLYDEELPRLDNGHNYWLLLVSTPMGPNFQVYDCKYPALNDLVYLSSGQEQREFCIVDKKYAWLLFYKINRSNNIVEIYNAKRLP
ncbi:hypothetical protein L3C95_18165 [Chitinophaga filiformis]|uniref:hypothetical protein n=1 Tax=Chitinophaga filiformis TaxID=104663 RepID=UPI001F407F62|nr:hypothetical protein [Chitinophaga filiformis]MCF6404830.1 hypothetical protein [Chitinophaga filiformis]